MFQNLAGRTPGLLDDERYRKYAILAPFLPEEGAFLFEVRAAGLRRQPGEICFPGGAIEPGESPREAALREACEELLTAPGQIDIVAPLDEIITPFYTRITPFLARLEAYGGTYNPAEVAEVFTVPLSFFLENEPLIYHNEVSVAPGEEPFPYELLGIDSYPWGHARYPVLFYTYNNRVIWGLTARIARHIALLLGQAQ